MDASILFQHSTTFTFRRAHVDNRTLPLAARHGATSVVWLAMNTGLEQEETVKYYSGRESAGVWSAIVACFAVIVGGSSIAAHSVVVTSCLLLGTGLSWWLGYWLLSRSCYYISPTRAGFKDVFRSKEVQFEEVGSVIKHTTEDSISLIFKCKTRTVTMPVDPIDEAWFSELKIELHRRGITISSGAFGFRQKEE